MEHPKIYVLIETPVIGELATTTIREYRLLCSVCNKKELMIANATYVYDQWGGQDIITAYDAFFVSTRLKELMERDGIKGAAFEPARNKRGQGFAIKKGAYQKKLPDFFLMNFIGKADGPDSWFKKGEVCTACGRAARSLTSEGIRSNIGPSLTGTRKDVVNPVPVTVYKDSWRGDDIFELGDPGLIPMVSQKFLDMLKSLGNEEVFAREAVWV